MTKSLLNASRPGSAGDMKTRGEVAVFARLRPSANFAQGLIECLPDGQMFKGRVSAGWYKEHWMATTTGAGKTYTMTGSTQSYKWRGIIPRALQEVFQEVEKRVEHSFSVHLSYLEIYNETLVDLLSHLQGSPQHLPRGLVVMEEPDGAMFIRGLSLHRVNSEEEALNLLFEGEMNRIIGSHAMNRNSSRSHCIFTMQIESRSRMLSDATYITSKLNLVDLAGSERLGKIGSQGQEVKEATYINKSLSFLEQVIVALGDRRRDHVPFRQSKLTHALKDSLGGNCNTVLVANIYGEAAQMEETLSTLRFASRMKYVRSDPAINQHTDPALQIKKLEKEVQMLKEELSVYNTLVNRPSTTYEPLSEAQLAEIDSQVQGYLNGSLEEISITSIRQVHAVFAQFKLAVQEEKQRVKAQLRQTFNQSAKTSASQEFDATGPRESVEASGSEAKQTHCPVSTKVKPMKSRDKQSKRQETLSPVLRKGSESASNSKVDSVQMPESEEELQDPGTQETQQPGDEPFYLEAPRSKAEVFEDFKLRRGNKINGILKENKAVLLERCSLLQQLTVEVNAVKKEIDCTTAAIQQHKVTRGTQGQYLVMESEQEANLILQLKELKALYRQRYKALCSMKAEVNYCQHLVDQCRVRLLSEFETWYKSTFLLPEKLEVTLHKTVAQHQQEQMENESSDSSSAESFYNTRCRTLRRRNSRLQSLTPVQKNLPAGRRRLFPPLPGT